MQMLENPRMLPDDNKLYLQQGQPTHSNQSFYPHTTPLYK